MGFVSLPVILFLYCLLCYIVPVAIHTIIDAFLQSVSLGVVYRYLALATAICFVAAAVVTVVKVIRWQKSGKLDVPCRQ